MTLLEPTQAGEVQRLGCASQVLGPHHICTEHFLLHLKHKEKEARPGWQASLAPHRPTPSFWQVSRVHFLIPLAQRHPPHATLRTPPSAQGPCMRDVMAIPGTLI